MSYKAEQHEKNIAYIEKEMKTYTQQQRNELLQQLNYTWPSDDEVKEQVIEKKKEIAKHATPEELDEVFKHLRV